MQLKQQRGSALLEVLIAVVLFAIGALGLLALNATMVARGKASVDQSIAATLADDFLSAIRADGARQLAVAGSFSLSSTLVSDFTARVTDQLPAGTVDVSIDAANASNVIVRIGWQGPSDPDPRNYRTATAVHP